MAGVEYDLDLTGGLMEEIERLVAPPETPHSARKRRIREREQRRPGGKTVNRDSCDSCQEGGDLLCCDRCPAAFHLQCHDPPLEEENVPMGEWVCHRCLKRPQTSEVDDDAASTCSSRSRQSEQSSTTSRKPRTRCRAEDDIQDVELAFEELGDSKKHPLEILARAASYMNPREFALPKDINCPLQLTGSSKRKWTVREWGRTKKPAHELDNGLVSLPAKHCFICSKSCRWAPLVPCDYCPLYFHLDCLDPPLCSLPTGRWMCPNHVEHGVDMKLLNSVRVTERVKLYDKFCSGSVNQHTIKTQFLNKIHRQHPPFRIKVKHARTKTVKVPEAIKAQYKFPPPLLPALGETVEQAFSSCVYSQGGPHPTAEEQNRWLAGLVNLHGSIAQHMALHPPASSSTSATTTDSESESSPCATPASSLPGSTATTNTNSTVSVPPAVKENSDLSHVSKQNVVVDSVNGDLSDGLSNGPVSLISGHCTTSVLDTPTTNGEVDLLTSEDLVSEKPDVWPRKTRSQSDSTNQNKSVSRTGNKAKEGCLGLSSIQTTTRNSGSRDGSAVTESGSSNFCSEKTPWMKVHLGPDAEVDVGQLDERLLRVLAMQRLRQLVPQPPAETDDKKSFLGSLEGLMTPEVSVAVASGTALQAQSADCQVQARALLCPLTSNGQPVPMPYRSLTVGTGADMNVCLAKFGHCNFVSSKHATIFYDGFSRQYELLNYSEHGTTVDNVLYSCDFSDKTAPPTHGAGVAGAVRKLISKSKAKQEAQKEREKLAMSARALQSRKPCRCRTSSSSLIGGSGAGWEGTALLHHGSYIKMGCVQFVFSIVEQATHDPRVEWKPATSLLQAQVTPSI